MQYALNYSGTRFFVHRKLILLNFLVDSDFVLIPHPPLHCSKGLFGLRCIPFAVAKKVSSLPLFTVFKEAKPMKMKATEERNLRH